MSSFITDPAAIASKLTAMLQAGSWVFLTHQGGERTRITQAREFGATTRLNRIILWRNVTGIEVQSRKRS